ncbi:alpha-amylase family glycosyl hydrolase [soil metagenome]
MSLTMAERPISAKELDFSPRQNAFPSPRDWRDQVIYQLLIDRFDDGGDHPPYHPGEAKRGRDPKDSCSFQGGKIKGITRRLDYIRGLGASAVWISPPFKNRQEDAGACHGYAIQDFLQVDPRFGTIEDLQDLTREAHARGMYVILDIVINHSGDNWGYIDDKPMPFHETGKHDFGFWRTRDGQRVSMEDAATGKLGPDDGVWPIELQNPDVYKRRGYIRDFTAAAQEEKVEGDFFSLKDLDLRNPLTLDTLIRIYKYWIALADIDGFRIDTVGHTEPGPTSNFINAIHEYARSIGKDNFIIYAEIVEGDEQLKKYVGHNTPADAHEEYPAFDAVLDFPLHFVLEEVIKEFQAPSVLRDRSESFRNFYRDFGAAGRYFVTFVDNHDQITRRYRRFMNGCDDPRQAILAIGYLLTSMGIPCIYYGTEQGFDGGGDTDAYVREAMFGGKWGAFDTTGVHFFNPNHPIYQGIAKIAKVREAEPALRYGRTYFREISGNGEDFGHPIDSHCTMAYARVLDTTSIIVAMNLTAAERDDRIIVDANVNHPGALMVDLLEPAKTYTVQQSSGGKSFVHVPLAGRTMAILKRKSDQT